MRNEMDLMWLLAFPYGFKMPYAVKDVGSSRIVLDENTTVYITYVQNKGENFY